MSSQQKTNQNERNGCFISRAGGGGGWGGGGGDEAVKKEIVGGFSPEL